MRISVDRAKCIGIGMCEAVAGDLFAVREDGTLEVLDDHPARDRRQAAEEAVAVCPASAITLVEDE